MKRSHNPELTPSPRSRVGEKVWQIVAEKFGFIELSEESRRNLLEANQLLVDNSLVVYINHTSTNDVPVGIGIALSQFTNAKRYLVPAGMKHYDMRRDFKNGLLMRMLKVLKMNFIPVVQQDDLESYPKKKRVQLLRKLKERTTRLISQPGSVYAITPEGTRSKSGQLLQAKTGIARIREFSEKPLYYLPIAIMFQKWHKTPQVVVGKPMPLDAIHAQPQFQGVDMGNHQQVADMLMQRVAELLPEENRGHYA